MPQGSDWGHVCMFEFSNKLFWFKPIPNLNPFLNHSELKPILNHSGLKPNLRNMELMPKRNLKHFEI